MSLNAFLSRASVRWPYEICRNANSVFSRLAIAAVTHESIPPETKTIAFICPNRLEESATVSTTLPDRDFPDHRRPRGDRRLLWPSRRGLGGCRRCRYPRGAGLGHRI